MTTEAPDGRARPHRPVAPSRELRRAGARIALKIAETFEQRAATLAAMGASAERIRQVLDFADRERQRASEWMSES